MIQKSSGRSLGHLLAVFCCYLIKLGLFHRTLLLGITCITVPSGRLPFLCEGGKVTVNVKLIILFLFSQLPFGLNDAKGLKYEEYFEEGKYACHHRRCWVSAVALYECIYELIRSEIWRTFGRYNNLSQALTVSWLVKFAYKEF